MKKAPKRIGHRKVQYVVEQDGRRPQMKVTAYTSCYGVPSFAYATCSPSLVEWGKTVAHARLTALLNGDDPTK